MPSNICSGVAVRDKIDFFNNLSRLGGGVPKKKIPIPKPLPKPSKIVSKTELTPEARKIMAKFRLLDEGKCMDSLFSKNDLIFSIYLVKLRLGGIPIGPSFKEGAIHVELRSNVQYSQLLSRTWELPPELERIVRNLHGGNANYFKSCLRLVKNIGGEAFTWWIGSRSPSRNQGDLGKKWGRFNRFLKTAVTSFGEWRGAKIVDELALAFGSRSFLLCKSKMRTISQWEEDEDSRFFNKMDLHFLPFSQVVDQLGIGRKLLINAMLESASHPFKAYILLKWKPWKYSHLSMEEKSALFHRILTDLEKVKSGGMLFHHLLTNQEKGWAVSGYLKPKIDQIRALTPGMDRVESQLLGKICTASDEAWCEEYLGPINLHQQGESFYFYPPNRQ